MTVPEARRALLSVAASASLIVSAAVAVLWARSGRTAQQFDRTVGRWEIAVDGGSLEGAVQLAVIHYWSQVIVGPPPTTRGPTVDAWMNGKFQTRLYSGRFGVDFGPDLGSTTGGRWTMDGRRLHVEAPFWGVVVVGAILPTLVWGWLSIRRHGRRWTRPVRRPAAMADPVCATCGYDLRSLSSDGLCPECGTSIADTTAAIPTPAESTRWAAGALLLAVAYLGLAATLVAAYHRNGNFASEYGPAIACAVCTLAAYAVGVRLITSGRHAAAFRPKRTRALSLLSVVALVAALLFQTGHALLGRQPFGSTGAVSVEWTWPAELLLLFGWVALCGAGTSELWYAGRLADLLGDPMLSAACRVIGVGLAATGLLLCYAAGGIFDPAKPLGELGGAVVAWIGFVGVSGLVHVDLAVWFYHLRSASADGTAIDRSAQNLKVVGQVVQP